MAPYFLDTSAVVKLYVRETGTDWMLKLADPSTGNFLYVGRITEVEETAALARRRKGRTMTGTQVATALQRFQLDLTQQHRVVEITPILLGRAAQLADRHHLRAYDAVQLATALVVHALTPELILISADAELNIAAVAEGMTVDDPNLHP